MVKSFVKEESNEINHFVGGTVNDNHRHASLGALCWPRLFWRVIDHTYSNYGAKHKK